MSRASLFALLSTALLVAPAQAQIRMPRLPAPSIPAPPMPPAPVQLTPGALQADLVVKAGSDTVYFPARGHAIDANAAAALAAQARWLLANPMVNIRLEGHGGDRDTTDYALAIGERRANAVRDYLILLGVPPYRISVISWGNERPGSIRIGPTTVAAGPRVVTKIL